MATTTTRFDATKLIRSSVNKKLALTVLSGGPSGEREISLQSGTAVAEALRSLGHNVFIEDIGPANLAALAREVDCVFVALHGTFGEDGQVQSILERRGLAYVGSGPDACALAMNKAGAKARFSEAGIPTPRFDVARVGTFREAMAAWSLPVVVKPVKEGSSLHCHIVQDFSQFKPAIEEVVGKYGEALIEEFIPGKEITVGVVADGTLPPIEIKTSRPFYDYQAKYVDDTTQYLFDIDLPPDLLARISEMSLKAHQLLGCRDFSRVDWRVDTTTMKPYLLEVNCIPGMTSHSLVPKAANKAGVSMPELCQALIDMAIKRKFARKA
jgi:D-alanine-D-alanine ligase